MLVLLQTQVEDEFAAFRGHGTVIPTVDAGIAFVVGAAVAEPKDVPCFGGVRVGGGGTRAM